MTGRRGGGTARGLPPWAATLSYLMLGAWAAVVLFPLVPVTAMTVRSFSFFASS